MQNSRARGRMAPKLWAQLYALYMPFVERLYGVLESRAIKVSPCSEQGEKQKERAGWTSS
eukprot:1720927-Prymnesium_polylepis.1